MVFFRAFGQAGGVGLITPIWKMKKLRLRVEKCLVCKRLPSRSGSGFLANPLLMDLGLKRLLEVCDPASVCLGNFFLTSGLRGNQSFGSSAIRKGHLAIALIPTRIFPRPYNPLNVWCLASNLRLIGNRQIEIPIEKYLLTVLEIVRPRHGWSVGPWGKFFHSLSLSFLIC